MAGKQLPNHEYITHLQERLVANVVLTKEGCWEWQGWVKPDGYGLTTFRSKQQHAHRVSYQAFVGPVPEGFHVCHRCDNRKCIRPEHLFVGTQRDNVQDCRNKQRRSDVSGDNNPNRTLSRSQVESIRLLYSNRKIVRVTQQELANQFGVSQRTISFIVRGEHWK